MSDDRTYKEDVVCDECGASDVAVVFGDWVAHPSGWLILAQYDDVKIACSLECADKFDRGGSL